MAPKVSIIVVNYRSDELVEQLVNSLEGSTELEIIIEDNSLDNKGFGAGCNAGARRARGEFLLFLNPDCQLEPADVKKLYEKIISDESIGIAAPQLTDSNGKPYLSYSEQPTLKNAGIVYSVLNKLFARTKFVKKHWLAEESINSEKEVGIVSGAAFMMRKSDFVLLGGFDERFFMYWEEVDLCRRVINDLNKRVVYFPDASIVHEKEGSTPKGSRKVKQWFEDSRQHFFQKHFGFLGSLLGGIILLSEHWQIILVLLLAAILRFWNISSLSPFFGDMGRDFLAAEQGLSSGSLPFLGIPSSVPRFKQGPLYVWLLMLIFWLFGTSVEVAAFVAAFLGLLSIVLLYFFILNRWGKRAAWVSSLVLAAAPLAVTQSRIAFHTNAIPLASLFFLHSLAKKPQSLKHFFLVGLSFALLFQFELAVFPLVLLVLVYIYYHRLRVVSWIQAVLAALSGALIGLLPQVLYDLTHSFSQLGLFLVWVAYRLVSFLGLTGEHAASAGKFGEAMNRFGEYGQKFLSWGSVYFTLALVLILISGLATYLKRKRFKLNLLGVSWMWVVVIGIGFFIHSGPSEAYFPVLFVPVSLLIGWSVISQKKRVQSLFLGIILIAALFNSYFLFEHDFMVNAGKVSQVRPEARYGPPLVQQKALVRFIVKNVEADAYFLKALGPGSEHKSYLDNYRFLFLQEGKSIHSEGVPIWFLYGDERRDPPLSNVVIYELDAATIALPLYEY